LFYPDLLGSLDGYVENEMKLKKACKLYPIVKTTGVLSDNYEIGDKRIYCGSDGWTVLGQFIWFKTESEAVAWLIEGTTPKAQEPKPRLEIVYKQPVNFTFCRHMGSKFRGEPIQTEITIELTPEECQELCDEIRAAGYRPNKDKPIS
jgi:hypothetical protein